MLHVNCFRHRRSWNAKKCTEKMLGMTNHFDISGSIEIREVDIARVACNSHTKKFVVYSICLKHYLNSFDQESECSSNFKMLWCSLRLKCAKVHKVMDVLSIIIFFFYFTVGVKNHLHYCNDPQFLDGQVWAKSIVPDPEILSASFGMLLYGIKQNRSNSRIITAIFWVSKFLVF